MHEARQHISSPILCLLFFFIRKINVLVLMTQVLYVYIDMDYRLSYTIMFGSFRFNYSSCCLFESQNSYHKYNLSVVIHCHWSFNLSHMFFGGLLLVLLYRVTIFSNRKSNRHIWRIFSRPHAYVVWRNVSVSFRF